MGISLYRRKNVHGEETGPYWARYHFKARQADGTLRASKPISESTYTESKTEAMRKATARLADLEASVHGDAGRVTLAYAIQEYRKHGFPTLKPRGIERYEVSIAAIIRHMPMDKPIGLLTSRDLSDFATARRRDVVERGKTRGQRVGNSTIAKDMAFLSAMFSLLISRQLASANPVPGFLGRGKSRKIKNGEPRRVYFTEDQEADLLAEIDRPDPPGTPWRKRKNLETWRRLKQAVIIAIETGLRPQELWGLQWHHVSLTPGRLEVMVPRELAKSNRDRAIPLSARAVAAFQDIERHPSCRFVFWHGKGTRYTTRGMDGPFHEAIERCGWVQTIVPPALGGKPRTVRTFEFYDLRKTAGCRWLQRDRMPMAIVSANLGHSSIGVTEKHYAFLEIEDRRAAMNEADFRRNGKKTDTKVVGAS